MSPTNAVPVYMSYRRSAQVREQVRAAAKSVAALALSAALISGWFFLRNWLTIGKAFGFGWDPTRGVSWRQDPGYRTAESFSGFGDALLHPFHAGYMGFWDSLYSTFWADGFLSGGTFPDLIPQWNYSFMAAGALFACWWVNVYVSF